MSSSLQEQLIQAGLADENSGKQSGDRKKRGRQRGKPQKRGKGGGGEQPRKPTGGRKGGDTAAATGSAASPAPKQQPRERTPEQRADQIRQLVRTHRIDRKYAAVPYRFTRGSRVREVAVTASQQGRIARGELGIVSDGERLELVPAKVARQVRGIDREAVVVLNTGREDSDDPEHPVPDDLMW